jgi:hypothetical protein
LALLQAIGAFADDVGVFEGRDEEGDRLPESELLGIGTTA